MLRIIVTDDFIDIIRDLSLKHIGILSKSFISVERIKEYKTPEYIEDLMEQMKNQELE